MSTLLTAVLTHYCPWIYTVSDDAPDRQGENKHKPKAVSFVAFHLQMPVSWDLSNSLIFCLRHIHTTHYGLSLGRLELLLL